MNNWKLASVALAAVLLGLTMLTVGVASPVEEKGEFTDVRDGQVYLPVEIGGMTWFARDLNFPTPNSYCYDGKAGNCGKYGPLYRWEASLSACPVGWHLSTEYEWQAMEVSVGLPFEELEYRSNRGTDQGARLKRGGDTGFETTYGGWRGYGDEEGSKFKALGKNAAYWTATEADMNHAWHRDIDTGDDMIWRSRVVKTYALSVRCVKNRAEFDQEGD